MDDFKLGDRVKVLVEDDKLADPKSIINKKGTVKNKINFERADYEGKIFVRRW